MQRLILLNGPSGIGKSTIAALYADEHPGTLSLDIDRVRTLIGGWREDFAGVGEIVRPLVLTMAAAHLRGGRDVVVPQYLAATDEVAAFERVANRCVSDFVEVVLMDTREASLRRFARPANRDDDLRRTVAHVVAEAGGMQHLGNTYDELLSGVSERPAAVTAQSHDGDIPGTLTRVQQGIDIACANGRDLSDPSD